MFRDLLKPRKRVYDPTAALYIRAWNREADALRQSTKLPGFWTGVKWAFFGWLLF